MTDLTANSRLIDPFGRSVSYLRLSVTDRCDLRCQYCMSEKMTFLPRDQVLSLEELYRVAAVFEGLGVSKIRVTGGEPLIRKGVDGLLRDIGKLAGINQLAITTNGTQLASRALVLKQAGVTALNISLDTLDHDRFNQVTRVGSLTQVLKGIDAACEQGFERVRLNSVVMPDDNLDDCLDLMYFAISKGIDIAFIEEMPLQQKGSKRQHDYVMSERLRAYLSQHEELRSSNIDTGGPARYWQTSSGTRVGFISPMSHNFCGDCNRVRVTVEGKLLLCLGNDNAIDLRAMMRDGASDQQLREAVIQAMQLKPERHHFDIDNNIEVVRFMSETGG